MTSALYLACAALIVAAVAIFSLWNERKFMQLVYTDQRRSIQDLTNRLLAAQAEGKVIPPSDIPVVDIEPPAPIDPAIEEWVQQWEDPNVQQRWRNIAQSLLTAGLSVPATLKSLEERLAR